MTQHYMIRCVKCAKRSPLDELRGKCDCGGTLLVEYDLDYVRGRLYKDRLRERPTSMWKYKELLPVRSASSIVSLGEGWTPLLRMSEWEKELGLGEIYVKREEQNPTGSFKARGFSVAVTLAAERGLQKVAVNSNGNAASALSAYAARARMEAYVFIPQDCPGTIVHECVQYGAHTYLIDGLIHDAAAIVEDGAKRHGWFHMGTLREPGRVEGKKTMGLELAEQFSWRVPDVIVYPTGGGSGIIGMWKVFRELQQLGWMEDSAMPRFISVQENGCHPLVDALRDGWDAVQNTQNPTSRPTGMRVPFPPDGELLTTILKESGGTALAVTAEEIAEAMKRFGAAGVSASPEGAATLAGLHRLRELGLVSKTDRIVLFNTSHALKYLDVPPPPSVPLIDRQAIRNRQVTV